ncbi:MAG: lipid A deacylase LpxR family protein [Lentimicrobium sp.]
MFRHSWLLAISVLLTVVSCRRPDPPVPVPPVSDSTEKEILHTFSKPVIAFIYPDNSQAELLKKEMGNDNYYSLSDQHGAEFAKARHVAEKQKLTSWSGTAGKYRFVTSDGAIIDIDLSRINDPWKVIVFNGKDTPVVAGAKEAEDIIRKYNHREIRSKNKSESLTSASKYYSEDTTSTEQTERTENFNSLPGLKETTLRLYLLPGQEPPPIRNETAGIRIINSYISPYRRFWLEFDNDMFSNTDRYYTNGVVLGYTAPALTSWQVNRLMIRHNHNSVVHSSISLHHGMFTPLTTKEAPTLANDRPYASALFIRYSQVSEDEQAEIRLSSAIDAGVIGEVALGQMLQRSVHAGIPSNDEPLGWETQIKNDLVLNYSADIQKQLVKSRHNEVYAEGSAMLGTLYTRATMGVNAVIGVYRPGLTPLPADYSQISANSSPWQYGARGGLELRMVVYDATLQGGMFNKNNVYALKPDEIERLVAAIHFGLFVSYQKFGLSVSQYYLSPEFEEGGQHFWGQIGLQFGL